MSALTWNQEVQSLETVLETRLGRKERSSEIWEGGERTLEGKLQWWSAREVEIYSLSPLCIYSLRIQLLSFTTLWLVFQGCLFVVCEWKVAIILLIDTTTEATIWELQSVLFEEWRQPSVLIFGITVHAFANFRTNYFSEDCSQKHWLNCQ